MAEGGTEQIRARVHVQPYPTPSGDGFVVSDMPAWIGRTGGRGLRPDHVVGIGGATITLATITPRDPVDQALDLGTGCGLQAKRAITETTDQRRTVSHDTELAVVHRQRDVLGHAIELGSFGRDN